VFPRASLFLPFTTVNQMLGKLLTRIGVAARIRGLLLAERDFLRAQSRMPAKIGIRAILKSPASVEIPLRVSHFISPLDRVHLIDVGANDGAWAKRLLCHFPNSSAECWEPLPVLAEQLRKQFADQNRFVVIQAAASSSDGKTTLIAPEHSAMASIHSYADVVANNPLHGCARTIEIETRRLDDQPRESAGRKIILKVDAQGHELEVLAGASDLLRHVELAIVESTIGLLFKDKTPTFAAVCSLMARHELFPAMFPSAGAMFGNFPLEQDIMFVRLDNLKKLTENR